MRGTGSKQSLRIREVSVDREPLHTGLFGDRTDRGLGTSHGLVEMNSGFNNALSSLILAAGPSLEFASSWHSLGPVLFQ